MPLAATLSKRAWTSARNIVSHLDRFTRLTSSTPLVLYLCLTLLHSFLQITLQLFVLTANFDAAHILTHVGQYSTAKNDPNWKYYGQICDPDGGMMCFDAQQLGGRQFAVQEVLGLPKETAMGQAAPATSSRSVASRKMASSSVAPAPIASPSPSSSTSSTVRASAAAVSSPPLATISATSALLARTSAQSSTASPTATRPAAVAQGGSRKTETFSAMTVIQGSVIPLTSVGVAPDPKASNFADFRKMFGQDGRFDAEESDSGSESGSESSDDGSVSSVSSDDAAKDEANERRAFIDEMTEAESNEEKRVVDRFLHNITRRSVALTVLPSGDLRIAGLNTQHDPSENTPAFLAAEATNDSVVVDQSCVRAMDVLSWTAKDRAREDVVLVFFMAWVAGMSIVAMLNESIPHVIAALCTHLLSTGWAAWQVSHTKSSHDMFHRVIRGLCQGVNVLNAGYWEKRYQVEVAILCLNIFALLMSGYLSWTLLRLYGWATFRNIGASIKINRYYRLVLSLSILLQLDLFFLITWVALWLDQLCTGPVAPFLKHRTIYKTVFALIVILSVPWVVVGWKAVRKEWRIGMDSFLGVSVLMVIAWAAMFASAAFVVTLRTWTFFAVITSLAAALLFITIALAIWCRINFGKGLLEYLNNHTSLSEDQDPYGDNKAPIDEKFEVVSFDSDANLVSAPAAAAPARVYAPAPVAIPTFSSAFPSGTAPPPSKMFPARPPATAAAVTGGLAPPRRPTVARSIASSQAPSWMPNDDVRPIAARPQQKQQQHVGDRRITPGSFQNFAETESYRSSVAPSAVSSMAEWQRDALTMRAEELVGSYGSGMTELGNVGGGVRRTDGLAKGEAKKKWTID